MIPDYGEVSLKAERYIDPPDPWINSPGSVGPWQVHWVSSLPLGPMFIEPAMLIDHGVHGVHPWPAAAFPTEETP